MAITVAAAIALLRLARVVGMRLIIGSRGIPQPTKRSI